MLCVLADGQTEWGDWIVLRENDTVLGRTQGDVRVPHDGEIAPKHAVISRRRYEDGFQWTLRDLDSTTGTFLRVRTAPLTHGQEFLIGSRRYQFLQPGSPLEFDTNGAPDGDRTASWPIVPAEVLADLTPTIVDRTGEAIEKYPLPGGQVHWIGRDTGCTVVVPDDSFADLRHAKIVLDPNDGLWMVEDHGSVNGVWWRIGPDETPLRRDTQFQLGEQRFRFRLA